MTDVVDVILRDGSTLRLRPPARDDAEAILAFFETLSRHSLYLRFHGYPSLGPEIVGILECRTGPSAGLCSARSRRTGRSA